MNLNTEPIKNWFGFSRSERRSTFILLFLTVLIIVFRYSYPDSKISVRDITDNQLSAEDLSYLTASDNKSANVNYSSVDVKTSYDSLRKTRRSVYSKGTINKYDTQGRRQFAGSHKPLIDINLSDSATLMKLPGIGPVFSARIIKYRLFLGGFARIEQLKEVYGLPVETFDQIKGSISVDSGVIRRININTAGYKELSKIRYLEKYEINAILKYKELEGRINGMQDLTGNKLISVDKAFRVRPYLKFDEQAE
jgi:DNA uptake protein ComE-like DNA-binding protein